MTYRKRTPRERMDEYYNKSASYLVKANELSERGEKAKAEKLYEKSAQWLMKFNELHEKFPTNCGY
jgi:hypothetical protein